MDCAASSSEASDEETLSETDDHISGISESSSEDEGDETINSSVLLSKDKSIQYRSDPPLQQGRRASKDVLNLTPGPTRYATSRIDDELSTFQLFFTKDLEEIILINSNVEGNRVYGDKWKTIDCVELRAYIGLLLLAGVFKSCNESTESLWDSQKGRAVFRATMSLQRFFQISRVLRFDDRETRSCRKQSDKFAAIRSLWDMWVEILPKLYNPSAFVTVDEQLVSFRGKCPFRQYMPSKPAKYGLKFWVLCDNENSYVWNIQPYTGKPPNQPPEKNQGLRVVMDLSFGLKGHNITCDNFFTSYLLGQTLLKRNVTMIGTIRKNKPSLPPELLQTKNKAVHSSSYAFTNDTMVVSHIPKKNKCVVLQSTYHLEQKVDPESKKPQVILDYNSTKGAVDTLDKMISCYTCKRKTNRWPVIVFTNVLDISAVNAYVLFTKANPDWKKNSFRKRRLFIETLGMSLVREHIRGREVLPRQKSAIEIVQSHQRETEEVGHSSHKEAHEGPASRKRGRCHLCPQSDNKYQNKCARCGKYTCKSHLRFLCAKCNC